MFLGYSLRDWNFRVLLWELGNRILKAKTTDNPAAGEDRVELLPSWAIQRSPSELEEMLWPRRKDTIFNIALEEFVDKLQERLGV